MEGKDHARIHTGRNDRNGRPRGSRRRTSLTWTCPTCSTQIEARDLEEAAYLGGAHELQNHAPEAEAGDQSLDGLHPGDEG